MSKLLGQLRGTIAGALLQTATLFLLLSSSVSHAQYACWDGPINPIPQGAISLSPQYWAPGHSYNVVLTSPGGYFPGSFWANNYVITGASFYAGTYSVQDPNVTVDPTLTYVGPTEVTFNATVAAGAPTESDVWDMRCGGLMVYIGPGAVQITPCAVPVAPGPLTPASIQSDTWVAGQQTAITITGSGFIPSNNPDGCVPTSLVVTAGSENVSVTNVNVVSSTQITATVQPQIIDPMETATLTVSNYQYNNPGTPLTSSTTAQIVPTTCIVPHISSISPNVWFAGNSYRNVTFTGTNFTTSSKATATCPVTTVSITTADGEVTVSGINVASSSRITGTVRVASGASTEGATAVAYGDTAPTPAADVMAPPDIIWASDPDGSSPTIGGPDTSLSDPSAVVGQQLVLNTTPIAGTLGQLPIPLSFSSTTWTVTGGTNIGGYTPTTTSYATGSVTPMTLNASALTFYSVYPAASVAVTFKYCVSGQTTCPSATTTFSITGPTGGTMTFAPVAPAVTIADLTTCVDVSGNTWPGGPYLIFATGVTGPACPGEANYPAVGIHFNVPTGYENDSGGSYELVQLIASDTTTGEPLPPTFVGLDTDFPYDYPPTSDSPKVYLQATATSVTRIFSANMFLMWKSDTTGSIPAPLGYQNWGFSATATCSASCDAAANWTATNTPGTTLGPVGDFVSSSPSQTQTNDGINILAYGYPTWTRTSQ